MVHVTSSQRSRGDEAKNGRVNMTDYISLFYSNFTVFVVLRHKDSLVISFPINRTPRAGEEASCNTPCYELPNLCH
jgi:hypothetical protein